MCGVSTSGYYNWKNVTKNNLEKREKQDRDDFQLILEAYNYKDIPKGHRGIYMYLLQHGIQMNCKKIRRLMKKFNLVCPIRMPKYQRQQTQAYLSEAVQLNHVKREFKAYGPRKVLLTDISYLPYGKQKWAYLATVKDAYTNEILAYELSQSLEIDFVLSMIESLCATHGYDLSTETMIHSDQGSHYTALSFREMVSQAGWIQSMSRRGNCWDNAPQESFFGHMKSEIDISSCDNFEQIKTLIAGYMAYYNNERYQWNLFKLSPSQFYQFYLTGVYPLADVLETPQLPKIKTIEMCE